MASFQKKWGILKKNVFRWAQPMTARKGNERRVRIKGACKNGAGDTLSVVLTFFYTLANHKKPSDHLPGKDTKEFQAQTAKKKGENKSVGNFYQIH